MVRIHLYGDLRRFSDQPRADRDTIIAHPLEGEQPIAKVLTEAGIPLDEVAQIFVNGKLLKTNNSMAPWLGYQTAPELERMPADGDRLSATVKEGDRIGLFPHRMAMLVV